MRTLWARLLLIILAALLPGLAFQVYAERTAQRLREALTRNTALQLVRMVSAEQEQIAEGARQVLTVEANLAPELAKQPTKCQTQFAALLAGMPRYAIAGLVGRDGHVICGADPRASGLNVSDRPYIRDALRNGRFSIGTFSKSRLQGIPVLHFAQPYRDRDGQVVGVVVLGLSLDWLGKQLDKLPLPPSSIASVTGRDGVIMARRPNGARYVGTRLPPDLASEMTGSEIGLSERKGLDGVRRIYGWSPTGAEPNGLRIAVGVDEADFAAVARADQVELALLILGVVFALAITTLGAARFIRRPVDRLLASVGRWTGGDLAARAGLIDDGSEFGRLGAAFDAMAEALASREAEIMRQATRLRGIVEALPGLVFVSDGDGANIFTNARYQAFTGRGPEELLGDRWLACLHPDDAPRAAALWRESVRTGGLYEGEYRFRAADGAWRWFLVRGVPVRDTNDRIERWYGICADITERKQTEAELRDREERFRELLDTLDLAPVFIRKLDGTIRFWSKGCERLYLWPAKEALGRRSHELLQTKYPVPSAEIEAALDRDGAWEGELVHHRRDRRSMTVVVRKALRRNAAGEPVAVMESISDVTALREAERELVRLNRDLEARVVQEVAAREAAQMRAAHAERMQALGQLAGGIAHDFNNILQATQGSAAMIEHRADNRHDVQRFAHKILEATERGAAITGRLLAFARRSDLRAVPLAPAPLLEHLREILAPTLGSDIAIRLELTPDLPNLSADASQLETTLVNLAINARDAMPNGGIIRLSAALHTIGETSAHAQRLAPGRYVRLAVSDSGPGMDQATLARAVEPFFTTKPQGKGTGLGLSMAKGFAEQSGGDFAIESAPGEGTTVTLWLPEATQTPAPDQERPNGPENDFLGRVLLVDDDMMVREAVGAELEHAGYAVLSAGTGIEALALINANEAIDCLVTDLSMPQMSGLALIREAQMRKPGLPAVLLTGYTGDGAELAVSGALSGAFTLLRKPISGQVLADRIAALLAVSVPVN